MAKTSLAAKAWVKGEPSPYQGHDITHFPDWRNLTVFDAYINNMSAGLMICACVAWGAGAPVFRFILPLAMLVALVVILVDLVVLIFDLGDPVRFIHSLRVMRFTSPLSVGVWGLVCYSIFLALGLFFWWLAWLTGWSSPAFSSFMVILGRLFSVMALLGAVVVICYKGVVFSCTSQPGLKNGRWLTPFLVSDSLLLGLSVYILITLAISAMEATIALAIPLAVLIVARCITFSLLWLDVKKRARIIYSHENQVVGAVVYGICGLLPLILAFCSAWGLGFAACLLIGAGLIERYWLIGLARPRK